MNWDSRLRLDYVDSQGIAAEVLFPNTAPPFYPSGVFTSPRPRSREEYELRFAGLRAHNRWLADFCSEAPERRAGFAQIFLDDIDDAVAEVRWAKENGLRGVLLPGDHVLKMVNLYYPRYDPLWAACAELELPVHRHAAAPTESVYEGGEASQLVHFVEIQFYTSRAISHLIFSGVFERHPDLLFVTTEIASATEIARDLIKMDMMYKLRDMGTGTPFYPHVKDALAKLAANTERVLRHELLRRRSPRSACRARRRDPEPDVGSGHPTCRGYGSVHRLRPSAPRCAISHSPNATSCWPTEPPGCISSISTGSVRWPSGSAPPSTQLETPLPARVPTEVPRGDLLLSLPRRPHRDLEAWAMTIGSSHRRIVRRTELRGRFVDPGQWGGLYVPDRLRRRDILIRFDHHGYFPPAFVLIRPPGLGPPTGICVRRRLPSQPRYVLGAPYTGSHGAFRRRSSCRHRLCKRTRTSDGGAVFVGGDDDRDRRQPLGGG